MVDEDLNQVCDTARSIFEAACGGSQSRALVEQASSSRDLWDILSQAGWLGIALPRNFRQAGLGMAGLAVLAEEAGRFSVTAPLLSTAGFFVPMVLSAAGERSCYDLLKPVLNHGHPAAVAFGEGFARGGPGRTLPSWDGQRLVGVTRQVQDAQLADLLAVVAMTDSGEMALAIVDTSCDGVVIEPCFGADPTRPLANVHLDIEIDQDHVIAGDLGMGLRFSTLALAAEMVGIAQRCVEMSAEHAVNRVQFGRPIGSFQGIKHRITNDMIATEQARSLVHAAAMILDEGDKSDLANQQRAVSMAKAMAGDAARAAALSSVQVHGALAMSWEYPVHLHLRRAWQDSELLGGSIMHYETIARLEVGKNRGGL